jgi:MFS family permease
VIAVVAPVAGRLSDRFGPVWPMGVGLSVLSVAMFLFSTIDVNTTYSGLIVPFVLMGIGIALVMSPMSTAAMNAVNVQKAGIASGVLQTSRMVGGTVGVAATGAIFQAELGSGFDPGSLVGAPDQAQAVFVDALSSAMLLAAAISALGMVIAVTLLRSVRAERPGDASKRREAAAPAAPAAEIG